MRLSVIKKTVSIYCNALKREEFKTPFIVTRAALADLLHYKDQFHLEQLIQCLVELLGEEFDLQTSKTLGLRQNAYDACIDVLKDFES